MNGIHIHVAANRLSQCLLGRKCDHLRDKFWIKRGIAQQGGNGVGKGGTFPLVFTFLESFNIVGQNRCRVFLTGFPAVKRIAVVRHQKGPVPFVQIRGQFHRRCKAPHERRHRLLVHIHKPVGGFTLIETKNP